MNMFGIAFFMGLVGSLHCAVMCGPIVLALPIQKYGLLNRSIQLVTYQLGRILVYTIFGCIAGWLGSRLSIFGNQKTLSLILGSILILLALLQLCGKQLKTLNTWQTKLILPLSNAMAKVFTTNYWGFFAGVLNGLIPCGMVYLAMASAIQSASASAGAALMLAFGMGTFPLMFALSIGSIYLKKHFRLNTVKLIPYFAILMGALFILRATELNIPFLSPLFMQHHVAETAICR